MISLDIVKKHLNLEPDFTMDDEYLFGLIEAAETVVRKDLTIRCESEMYDEEGEIKPDIKHAILLLVGTWYASRESVAYGVPNKVPHAYEYIISLNKNYSTYYK